MSRSNDAGHFFQTSDALATGKRKAAKAGNKHGQPISLPSKILAVHHDLSHDAAVFVAEAAGDVKRVVLESGEVRKILSRGTAPLTCLTICSKTNNLFAGSWDKHIYAVKIGESRAPRHLSGHSDFVKCLLTTTLNDKQILISGGADAVIIVWDIATGTILHKLKGHTKSLQDLTLDPEASTATSVLLFTASSDREIRRWHISIDSAYEVPESISAPILAHETSVYKIRFDSDGDLWTASADMTAKHLVRSRDWEADTVLSHPDFVRDVVVDERLGLVVTACRDEEVRVWDASSGKLLCTYSGHFEEVTGLVLVGSKVVSGSIDATVRQWGLGKEDMAAFEEEMRREAEGQADDVRNGEDKMLTEEEEAELAELMEDD